MAVLLVPVTALILTFRVHERFSAGLVTIYWAWVLYDLARTFVLWRMNG